MPGKNPTAFGRSPDLTIERRFAESLADAARRIVPTYFRKPLTVDIKADDSPVTLADREIERVLREMIAATYPDHGIFGEEQGVEGIDRRHVWVIDPIDGTKSFISGFPLFGTLIALLQDGVPVLGVVEASAMVERWVGIAGVGSWLNGTPCHTSDRKHLDMARLYATSPEQFSGDDRARFDLVSSKAALRRFGGDCYAYALVASGHIDAVVETGLKPYDYLPLAPVIQAAGGVMTDWQGAPLSLRSDGHVVAAATPELHSEIMELLR